MRDIRKGEELLLGTKIPLELRQLGADFNGSDRESGEYLPIDRYLNFPPVVALECLMKFLKTFA